MKSQKNSFFRWLSINRHRRRVGAGDVMRDIHEADLEKMRTAIVDVHNASMPGPAPSQATREIKAHLDQLRKEFHGKPELTYHHARLIVLIRREAEVHANYQRFRQLWDQYADFLLQQLSLRWLVSACDTFIDHDDDPVVQSLMMAAVLLVNTVKLQETERILERPHPSQIDPQVLASLHTSQLIFDGLSPFAVGDDDTLRNMRWRLERLCRSHPLGAIPLAIFERLQQPDNSNVYSRFRRLPMKQKTEWWR
ncbi:MAG: hypothetical protein QM617_13815 [Comamonas sp.]